MFDPFLWYSGSILVIAFKEEQEEAVGELQCLVEWQAAIGLSYELRNILEKFMESFIYTFELYWPLLAIIFLGNVN